MDRFAVATGEPLRITDWQRSSAGLVTINTISAVNYGVTYATNNYVTISNVDPSLDGTYQITTAVNTTNYTISTQNTTAVTQTTVDNAYMKRLHKIVYYTRNKGNSSSTVIESVKSYTQSTNVLTVTTNVAHTIGIGNVVVLFNVKDDLDYRPYTVTGTTSNTFTVNVNYALTESNTASIGGYYNTSLDNYLANTTGNVVYAVFDTVHGLSTGDSLSISGLSSSIDGTHQVVVYDTSTVAYFVDSNSLREPKASSNVRRTAGSTTVTVVTTTNHGFTVGDSIYVSTGTGAVGNVDGQWVMYSNINATAFTYISGGTSAVTDTSGNYIHASPVDNYAEQVFPILSKTNTTFTYFHSLANTTTSATLSETPGKIVKNSDGTMRVYFKSGWIG
jgi:hypothetical protein